MLAREERLVEGVDKSEYSESADLLGTMIIGLKLLDSCVEDGTGSGGICPLSYSVNLLTAGAFLYCEEGTFLNLILDLSVGEPIIGGSTPVS